MADQPALYQWTVIVGTHLPALSTAQVRVLAQWSLGLVLALSKATLADSVTFTSSAISLQKVTIQSLQGGQLIYLDGHGQRQQNGFNHRSPLLDVLDGPSANATSAASSPCPVATTTNWRPDLVR